MMLKAKDFGLPSAYWFASAYRNIQQAGEFMKQCMEQKCAASLMPKLISQGKPASSSRVGWGGAASRAVDGRTSGHYGHRSCTHTHADQGAWWSVNLGGKYAVSSVKIWNRVDCCQSRLNHIKVSVDGKTCATIGGFGRSQSRTVSCSGKVGSVVKVEHTNRAYLTLCEVQVYGTKSKASGPDLSARATARAAGRRRGRLLTMLVQEAQATGSTAEQHATASAGWSCG